MTLVIQGNSVSHLLAGQQLEWPTKNEWMVIRSCEEPLYLSSCLVRKQLAQYLLCLSLCLSSTQAACCSSHMNVLCVMAAKVRSVDFLSLWPSSNFLTLSELFFSSLSSGLCSLRGEGVLFLFLSLQQWHNGTLLVMCVSPLSSSLFLSLPLSLFLSTLRETTCA